MKDDLKLKISVEVKEIAKTLYKAKKNSNVSLMTGMGGQCLTLFYLARMLNSKKLYNKSFILINEIFDLIELPNKTIPTYCDGLTGIGMLLCHLQENNFLDITIEDTLSTFDEYIINNTIVNLNSNNYDYLHGAIGNGIYLLKRIEQKKVQESLEQLIDRLYSGSKYNSEGRYWHDILWIGEKEKKMVTNLSLSHGQCSKILFFVNCYKKGIKSDLCKEIINECVNFILNNQTDKVKDSSFPSKILNDNEKEFNERLGWCYGDLGFAFTLFTAGDVMNEKGWKEKGLEVAHKAAQREVKQSGAVDACFCHGTAGIAFIFYVLHKKTQIKEFETTYINYINHSFKLTIDKGGFSEYQFLSQHGWNNNISLLDGLSGVGLVYKAIIEDNQCLNNWDELFLLN